MSEASNNGTSKRRLLLLLLVVAAIVVAVVLLPTAEWLQAALDWIEGLGVWGPVALVGIYVLACIFFISGAVLTLGAGAAFGVVQGTIAVSIGATLGATAAFLVGRHLARSMVESKVAGSERFAAIDEAVGQHGFKIVMLTRLSPAFPFVLLNYAYGLTKVRLRDYFLASWLGMIPGTIMYVYLGYAAREAAAAGGDEGGRTPAEWTLLAVGLAATVAVTIVVTKIARRALDQAVPAGNAVAAQAGEMEGAR